MQPRGGVLAGTHRNSERNELPRISCGWAGQADLPTHLHERKSPRPIFDNGRNENANQTREKQENRPGAEFMRPLLDDDDGRARCGSPQRLLRLLNKRYTITLRRGLSRPVSAQLMCACLLGMKKENAEF